MAEKVVRVRDFINGENEIGVGYKDYWKESNINKNVFLPHEQLMTIEKRIIWSAYKIGMANMNHDHKTPELSGEVLKYHISGEASIHDSIKGLATDYKRQPACRILKGIGNMGTHAGDPGAAARYTYVRGTPLLKAIIRDIKHVPIAIDETGVDQPEYLSIPIPMVLINGLSNIGTGHSAYYDERDAREVIDWIQDLVEGRPAVLPDPISTTGCKVYKNPVNGYTYYEAKVHTEGKFDIITNLPPKVSTKIVIDNLQKKLSTRIADKIENASEEGRPIWIKVPKGHIHPEDYTKYAMRKARKEMPYVWDKELDTMKMSSHEEIAIKWYESRKEIIAKRLKYEISQIDKEIHKIDLIVRYDKEDMKDLSQKEIVAILGSEDAEVVLSQTARVFLKENIQKALARKERLLQERDELESKNVHNLVFEEARSIIVEQEKYFAQFES